MENKLEKNQIQIVTLEQLPILEERIDEASEHLKKMLSELNLDKLIVTEQSRKSIKQTRADLNNQFKYIESQRKAIERAYNKPLENFKEKYKKLIASPFKDADVLLKNKVFIVEDKLKKYKADTLKKYFIEICDSKDIDFLKFEDLEINITLTGTETSFKKQILSKVEAIEKNISLIFSFPESDDFKTDVLIEYKKNRDLTNSVNSVQSRNAEKKRLQEIEKQKEEKPTPSIEKETIVETKILKAPVLDIKEDVLQASFTVEGTLNQLKDLKKYLKSKNIKIITK